MAPKPATFAVLGSVALLAASAYVVASAIAVAGPPRCTPGPDCEAMVGFATGFAFMQLLIGVPGFAGTALLRWKPRAGAVLLALGVVPLMALVGLFQAFVLAPAAVLWAVGAALALQTPAPARVVPPA